MTDIDKESSRRGSRRDGGNAEHDRLPSGTVAPLGRFRAGHDRRRGRSARRHRARTVARWNEPPWDGRTPRSDATTARSWNPHSSFLGPRCRPTLAGTTSTALLTRRTCCGAGRLRNCSSTTRPERSNHLIELLHHRRHPVLGGRPTGAVEGGERLRGPAEQPAVPRPDSPLRTVRLGRSPTVSQSSTARRGSRGNRRGRLGSGARSPCSRRSWQARHRRPFVDRSPPARRATPSPRPAGSGRRSLPVEPTPKPSTATG